MKFKIVYQRYQKVSSSIDDAAYDFFLDQDKWDDFGYHILYHVDAGKKVTKADPEYLGSIKIMGLGEKDNEYYLIA